jgi:hypothetical protein
MCSPMSIMYTVYALNFNVRLCVTHAICDANDENIIFLLSAAQTRYACATCILHSGIVEKHHLSSHQIRQLLRSGLSLWPMCYPRRSANYTSSSATSMVDLDHVCITSQFVHWLAPPDCRIIRNTGCTLRPYGATPKTPRRDAPPSRPRR